MGKMSDYFYSLKKENTSVSDSSGESTKMSDYFRSLGASKNQEAIIDTLIKGKDKGEVQSVTPETQPAQQPTVAPSQPVQTPQVSTNTPLANEGGTATGAESVEPDERMSTAPALPDDYEARRRNLYGTLYNASLAKDQATGALSRETHALAMKAFEPEENPFHINYNQEKARENTAAKISENVSAMIADAKKAAAEKEAQLSYDLVAGQAEIDKLAGELDAVSGKIEERNQYLKENKHIINDGDARNAYLAVNARLIAEEKRLSKLLSEKRLYHRAAQNAQAMKKWHDDAINAEDFVELSGYRSTKLDTAWGKLTSRYGMGYGDIVYEYINQPNMRGEIRQNHSTYSRESTPFSDSEFEKNGYDHMNPEEISIYNYYYAKFGKEKAEEYLSAIVPNLINRAAQTRAVKINDTWYELPYNFVASAEKTVTNIKQGVGNLITGSEKEVQYSPTVTASQIVMSDNEGVWKLANDVSSTAGGMLPSVLVGTVHPIAGAAVTGLSTAGNAYNEMIRLGYSTGQSRAYALLAGGSEAGLQYILGGISKLGGKVTGKVATSVTTKLDNALAKVAINHPNLVNSIKAGAKLGISVGGEITEEEIQLFLEPLFKTWVTNETYLAPNFEEIAYTAIVTALTTGVIEGSPNIVSNASNMANAIVNPGQQYMFDQIQSAGNMTNAKKENLSTPIGEQAPINTPEANGGTVSSDTGIPQSTEFVKGDNGKTARSGGKRRFGDAEMQDFMDAFSIDEYVEAIGADEDVNTPSATTGESSMEDLLKELKEINGSDTDTSHASEEADVNAELAKDPEIAAIIKEIEAESTESGVRSTADRALGVQADAPKVRAKDLLDRGGMLPTAEQDYSAKKAASAKTETARTGYLSGASEADIRIAESMAKLTGREIIFAGEDYEADGEFDGNNTIIVNPKRGNVLSQIIAHELTHSIVGTKEYASLVKSLKTFVNTYSERGMIADWDTLYSDVWKDYEKKHEELTGEKFDDAKAEKEIVARVMETFFGEGEATSERQVDLANFVMEFTAANKNAATCIWYELSKMAKRIREDIAHYATKKVWGENYDSSYREHQLMLRKIEDLRDQFGRALMQAKGKPGDGKRALKINDTFSSDIDSWAHDGKPDGERFILGSTGNVLQGLGAIESDIYMNGDKINTILSEHPEMTLDEIKKIPQILENPVLILKSRGTSIGKHDNTRLVIFGTVKAQDGRSMLSVLDLRPQENNLVVDDMQKVVSAYTKDNNPTEFVENSDVLYASENEKITTRLLRSIGFQMPIELNRSGYIGSISYFGRSVNISGEKFSDVFSVKANSGANNSSGKSFSLSKSNTTPQNEVESQLRAKAVSMYADMRKAQKAQRATDITEESIYEQTGWYFDDYGNFVVDREAPVYLKAAPVKQQRYVDNARRMAESAEAHASEAYAENAALREDVAKWKARAESAEKAARIIERDVGARIKADRELSPDYMPSVKQVEGIVTELAEQLGGGFSKKQIKAFAARLVEIYDKIGANARYASDMTAYSREIADLISDMQDVRLENPENAEIASELRGALKTPVYVSEKARGDLKGGYGATVRKYRGKVPMTTKERGTPVDVRYMELSDAYPSWFPADIINEADQLNRMLEVSDKISDRDFASRERYAALEVDPKAARTYDFDKAMMRIIEGYGELERIPRTFADGLMRQLEYNEREYARLSEEERDKLRREHESREEALMREAEAAMEWETRRLNDELSSVYADIRDAERKAADDARAAKEAADRRAHERGRDIQDAAIKAAQADGSFTKKMTELYERYTELEDEIARIQAECKKHEHVDTESLRNNDERKYIKDLRARRDALIEKKSNLDAYINKVNARVKDIRFKTMCDMIAKENYLKGWHDKAAPIFHAMETMRRNVLDIAPKKGDSAMAKYIISEILDPITAATYSTTLVRNQVRDRVKGLKLATKPHKGDVLSESQFVQAYGEAKDNIDALSKLEGSFIYNRYGEPMREGMTADEWRGYLGRIIEENPGITKDPAKMKHMEESVKVFKDIYDDLFTIVNAARVRNGYAPVPYHRGYFPHYNNDTKQDGVFSSLLKGLGLREQEISEKLPTSINGLTATFRPGIRYMSNAKQRSMAGFEGDRRVTGAVEGLDRYIEVATDVAFQTDNVQNLRSLSNAIRYATTSQETQDRVSEIRNDDSLTRDQKQERINEIFANKTDKTKYALNNFIVELEEYTNQLAGKKSTRDREYERLIGRSLYTAAKRITGNTAANAIAGNIGSAITNFIPLMDGGAVMHYHMLGAMWDMMQGHIQGDGFVSTSKFLTNRRGSDRLMRSGKDKASDVLGSPMSFIDNITSELLMRARVRQNMSKHRGSMSYQAAMNEADTFIAGMMGDRSKGALPTIFGVTNPMYKALTMYQVEVKNQFGFILKDLPRDSDKGEFIAKIIAMAVLHALFNDLYEKLVGRRPALDPLHMLNDLSGDLFGWEFASFDQMMKGNIIKETDKKGKMDAVMNLLTTAASEAPFIGGLLGGGRIPISSVIPDWDYLKKAVTGFQKGNDGRKIAENLYKGASPVIYYGVMPMAGGAVKKVVEGVNAFAKGGSYTYDAEGNRKLQYPMYTDEGAASVGGAVKSAVFGKTSTEGGRAWVEGGFGSLSAKQTACYEAMVKAGEGQRESWELLNELRDTNPDKDKNAARIDVLLKSDVIDEAKEAAFLAFIGTGETMPELVEELRRKKVDFDDFLGVYKVKLTASGEVKEQVLEAIDKLDISKDKKDVLYLCWYSEKSIGNAPWNTFIRKPEAPEVGATKVPKSNAVLPW